MDETMDGEKLFKSVELKKENEARWELIRGNYDNSVKFSHSKLKPCSHPIKVFLSFCDDGDDDGSESEDSEAKLISGKASF